MKTMINDKRTTIQGKRPVFNYSNDEKETVLNYDYANKEWRVWTSVTSHITKILKLNCIKELDVESVSENGIITSIRATLSKSGVSFRNKMSEEQRGKARERFKENMAR